VSHSSPRVSRSRSTCVRRCGSRCHLTEPAVWRQGDSSTVSCSSLEATFTSVGGIAASAIIDGSMQHGLGAAGAAPFEGCRR
jgi:hypothetical protein